MPITYTIKNLSTTTSADINYFTFADDSAVSHSTDYTTGGWNSPWSAGGYSTESDTVRKQNVTWRDEVSPVSPTYIGSTGTTTLILSSTADIQPGWTIDSAAGNGFTSNQSVVSITSATWLVVSDGPDSPSVPGEIIRFEPPNLWMVVNNNSGVQVGWRAYNNGYNGETAISTSGTQWIEMSAESSGNPSFGGTVQFRSASDVMVTIPPGGEINFNMSYSNNISSIGDYYADVAIYADIGGVAVLNVNNIVAISAAPVTPSSDYYGGGSGGFDAGTSIGGFDSGFGFAGLQGSQGFGMDATDGSFGGDIGGDGTATA